MGTLQEALVAANLVSEEKVKEHERNKEIREVITGEKALEEKRKALHRELKDVCRGANFHGQDWVRGELDELAVKYPEVFDQVVVEYAYSLNLKAG